MSDCLSADLTETVFAAESVRYPILTFRIIDPLAIYQEAVLHHFLLGE